MGAPAVPLDALPGALPEPLEGPPAAGDAHERAGELAREDEPLQGREHLLHREIAGRAVEDERVGVPGAHGFFSACPPKAARMAERTFPA